MKTSRFLLYAAFALAICSCGTSVSFQNPVWPENRPDPTAIFNVEDGYYYCYATGWNSPFIRSKDLCNWENTDIRPFTEETVSQLKGLGESCWAPQFAKIGDTYMLYLTIRSSCPDSRIVATASKSLLGPYEFKGVVTDGLVTGIKDTIDPFVFTDEATGKVWLVFGSVGRIHQVELNAEGTALAEGSQYRHIAGEDVDNDSSRLSVFEGSYVYHHDGWWYLFCSAGRYNDYSYAIVTGRSREVEGPYLTRDGKPMTEGNGTVVLSTSPYDHFYGPGHDGEIFTGKGGRTYMIYHVHVGDFRNDKDKGYIPRPMNLQRVYWDKDGWPYMKNEEMQGGKIVLSRHP